MSYFVGIDVGTFESKGVLTDIHGTVLAEAVSSHKMLVPNPGWAEHRPKEDWWGDVTTISRSLLQQSKVNPRDVKAICTSAIGPCMLPLDADGEPLMNGVLYGVDTRATDEIASLTEKIGAEKLLARCNGTLTSQSVGPKILWLKNKRPELYEKARMFLSATPYIVYRLTGEYVQDHFTASNFTPLYDPHTNDWSEEFCEGVVKREYLPRLAWSSDIVGHVTAKAAAESGLAEGTAVICGTIDAAAEALSVGVTRPGDLMMMYGSTIFVIQVTANPVGDSRLWYAPWIFKGLHTSQAGLATSGTLTRWLGDQLFQDRPADSVIVDMCKEGATSPPGSRGLISLPYFSGERTPIHDPQAKGVIFGLDLTHTRADIYRSCIEGIGCAIRHIIDTYEDSGNAPRRIVAVGGGIKNEIWLKATSDISGYPQVLRNNSIGASLGDAFMAAMAMGCAELDDIEQWNPLLRVHEPDTSLKTKVYDPLFEDYKELYAQTKTLMHRRRL